MNTKHVVVRTCTAWCFAGVNLLFPQGSSDSSYNYGSAKLEFFHDHTLLICGRVLMYVLVSTSYGYDTMVMIRTINFMIIDVYLFD